VVLNDVDELADPCNKVPQGYSPHMEATKYDDDSSVTYRKNGTGFRDGAQQERYRF
jgi:hypothetical protein